MELKNERRMAMPNGSQLIAYSAPHLNTASFSVVLPFVPESTPGVYHFVEHMFFERAGKMRAKQINAVMNANGSEIMGYTSVNYMCFNFTCRKEVLASQLSLLYSMLNQREYGEEEFEKVLPVVRNEIFEYEFYDTRAGDILRDLWFDSRYISSVLGSASVLENVSLEELAEAREKLFGKGVRMFLAGAFSEEDVRKIEDTFGQIPLTERDDTPAREEEKETREYNRRGRGREMQVLVTYHVERASFELKMAAHWLRSALFDGLDATFFRFFGDRGFQFYSVDGNYSTRGDELVFSYLAHIEKKEMKEFTALVDEFEEAAAKTDFLALVRPYLYDNAVLLLDNPERLCSHYVDTWADLSEAVTLGEETKFCGAFTNQTLAKCWKEITSSLRRIFYIGK